MQQDWDCIDAIPAIQKKEIFNMFTKDFFDKHFRMHNKLTLYTKDNIKMTVTTEYHFRVDGGHHNFTLHDSIDLADFANRYNLSTKPNKEVM